MTRTFFRVTGAAILLAVLAGCTSTRMSMSPRDIEHAEVKKIEAGETTKEEIISMFGAPVSITVNSKGFEVYMFISGDSKLQMWQVPPIFVIYVDSVSSAKFKMLSVTFSGDTVIDWNFSVRAAGGGSQAGGVSGGMLGE